MKRTCAFEMVDSDRQAGGFVKKPTAIMTDAFKLEELEKSCSGDHRHVV